MYAQLSSGFFTPAAEITKTAGQNSIKKLTFKKIHRVDLAQPIMAFKGQKNDFAFVIIRKNGD